MVQKAYFQKGPNTPFHQSGSCKKTSMGSLIQLSILAQLRDHWRLLFTANWYSFVCQTLSCYPIIHLHTFLTPPYLLHHSPQCPKNNENELLCEGRCPHQLTPVQRRNKPRLAPHWANQEQGRGSFWQPSVGSHHLVNSKPWFWTAYLLISSNGLHTSWTRDRHSTIFGFVEGSEGFYHQCWAIHTFENGRTDMFFHANCKLICQDLTPVVCECLIDLPILEPIFL